MDKDAENTYTSIHKPPYTLIPNELIRDNTISPNCRLVLMYLLAHKEDISVMHLYHEFKRYIGKNVMHKIINEAITAGYMKRESYMSGNMKRFKYYISEKPLFKI